MTCQHCETQEYEAVILDDDYRCRRCGRRVRSTPAPPSSHRFPVEAAATARAYEIEFATEYQSAPVVSQITENLPHSEQTRSEQQRLFEGSGSGSRIIAFESLTTRAQRQSIHARVAGLARPSPVKTEKVQVKHARAKHLRSSAKTQSNDQSRLEFDGQDGILAQPRPSIICDAPVAPARLRLEATLIDGCIMALPCCLAILSYKYVGGSLGGADKADKYVLPLLVAGLATIPLFYKVLWAFVGRDSIGMQRVGLQLVDFDGNPPSQSRRYQRLAGSVLSLLAAGIGLVWSLVDEDRLTWHDHISNTFPTFAAED